MITQEERMEQLRKAREIRPKKVYKGIAKVSEKRKKQIEEEKMLQELDKEFYLTIWAAAPHKCYECGNGLGKVANNIFFHHLLPKSRYPEFRHTPENIALVCLTCHSKCENNIDFAPKIKLLTEQAKKLLL